MTRDERLSSGTTPLTQPEPRTRVLFLSRKWPPAVGGMETYSIRLCESLSSSVLLTKVVLSGRPDGTPPSTLSLLGFGFRAFLAVVRHRRAADVVHIGDMASWPIALGASLAKSRPSVVLSAHGTDVSFPRRRTLAGKLYGAYLRLGSRLLNDVLVIANSAATETAAREFGFDHTEIVPLGTDFTRQCVAPDLNRLLFSGRIIPLKGLDWFVRNVLEKLPEEITLDVAGTVWDTDEAKVLNHPRVRYLGRLDQASLAVEFARSLALVVPNVPVANGQFEGFGLVAIEAAAAGGVVLASDHGGLREAVQDGVTGFSLPAGDARAWIDRIMELRGWSKTERDSFVETASRQARETYSWERVARDTLHAYLRTKEIG